MRNTLLMISLLAAAFALAMPETSSAQHGRAGAMRGPGSSGIVDSDLEKIGPPGTGPGIGPDGSVGIVSPRDVTAAIKDRVMLQNRLRRRWEAAGPEERDLMLDVQRKLRQSKLKGLSDVDRDELLQRVDSRAMLSRAVERAETSQGHTPRGQSPVMSTDQRRVLRERVRDLSPDQRQRVRDRIRELRALDEVDQAILRDQLQHWLNLSEADRVQLNSYRGRWEGMTPEQQDAMRLRMLRLHEMSTGARRDLLQRAIGDRPAELP